MLTHAKLVGFVATAKPAEAKRFYQEALGLTLVEDGPFAIVFDANGTTVRIQKVLAVSVSGYTAIGWEVDDLNAVAKRLTAHGISLQRYDGLEQDRIGVWRTPDGSFVAWFQDPDGNLLSLTQHAVA